MGCTMNDQQVTENKQLVSSVINEISKVIIGKENVIELALTAMIANGHVLFEDIPGVGKTTLVKTLAKATQCSFGRIQFTPDLLPSDILGVSLFDLKQNVFSFKKGPIFHDIILADEINRTTPKTQSALLESMNEKQVTIDNTTYPLNEHFFVLATQNPIDYEGTYPLIEAQLDRFLLKLTIGYPSVEEEATLLLKENLNEAINDVKPILDSNKIKQLKELVKHVHIHSQIVEYILKIVQATRNHPKIKLGVSPRGSIALVQAIKAYAIIKGRDYCTPDDVKKLVKAVFSHRLILHARYRMQINAADEILQEIVENIEIPVKKT